MSIYKICPICGKEYKARREKQVCCSKSCSEIKKHGIHIIKCDYCGKEYRIKLSDMKRAQKHYCSKECKNSHQKITKETVGNLPKKRKKPSICPVCGKSFIYKRKGQIYCSRDCRGKADRKRIKVICDYCGKMFERIESEIRNKQHIYCSSECRFEHQKTLFLGENNPNYNNIGSKNPLWKKEKTIDERNFRRCYIEGYNAFIRDKLRSKNYTCECCGKHGGNMQVHHLNGFNWDKENIMNPNNTVVLCDKCHKEFHKIYKFGDNTIEQYKEWIIKKSI